MLCSWVPNKAKSRSLGLAYSAGQVGNILAMVISPVLINNLGWEVGHGRVIAAGLMAVLAPLYEASQVPVFSCTSLLVAVCVTGLALQSMHTYMY